MKNYLTLSAIILFASLINVLQAQDFNGIATYKSSSQVDFSFDSTKVSSEKMVAMKQQIQQMMRKEYELKFNRNESNWVEIESLGGKPTSASSNGMEMVMMTGNGNALLYKNIGIQQYEKSTEIMGKRFIIKDSLEKYNWKLVNEFKQIGEYKCQKAVYEKVVEARSFSTGMEEMETVMDTTTTTAWFTMDIPVSNGPLDFYGLPGLILELKTGKRIMICTKIELNPEKGIKIERPKKGKVVTEEEYRKVEEEKLKEMMNRYQGSGEGASLEIVVGG